MKQEGPPDPEGRKAPPDTEQRIDRIAEEFLDSLQEGETPDRKALASAHPDIADLLERRLALVELMYQARPPEKRAEVPPTRPPGKGEGSSPPGESDPPDLGETIDLSSQERPERIGPYKILDVLGEGGMGIVYLADQTEPVRRRIALKLIKLGRDTEDVIRRFESERQALARMNHPSISHVFEAGTTALGRPYFAMEHVPGVSITEYCDKNRLTTPERLNLFIQVCGGVQHAHQKGIIHRDLKPTNILVTVPNGSPVPKIIDFGVAKAINQRLTEETVFTEHGQLIGTLEYMSPEQADARAFDIDTRSDIYSLGVILYELLVGALPIDSKDLRRGGLAGLHRRIREEEPPKPSTRVSTLGEDSSLAARCRRTDPSTLTRLLKGDLDWITMKAMEKDRVRRYATASELAADLSRHLNLEPVLAGPPRVTYLLGKFVRKHRALAYAVLAVAAVLLLGIVTTTAMFFRSERARDEKEAQRLAAEKEARKLAANVEFLRDLLGSVDPGWQGADVRVAEVLKTAAEGLEEYEDKEVEAELQDIIGWAYWGLAFRELAEKHLRRALVLRGRVYGASDRRTLRTQSSLGLVLASQRKDTEAETLYRQALRGQQELLGGDRPDTESAKDYVTTKRFLAVLLQRLKKLDDAERLLREGLETSRTALGEADPETLYLQHEMASVLKDRGRYSESEALYEETLDLKRRVLGEGHSSTLNTMNDYGHLLLEQDRPVEAERLLQAALDGIVRRTGQDHPYTLTVMNNLANAHQRLGEWAEAERGFRYVVETRIRRRGEVHDETLSAKNNLAWVLMELGQTEEAEELLRGAYNSLRKELGERHPRTLKVMNNLARLLTEMGKLDEADMLFEELLEKVPEKIPEVYLAVFKGNHGRCLATQGRFDEAEALLLPSYATLEAKLRVDHQLTQKVLGHLVFLYEAWEKPEEAERYREKYEEPPKPPGREEGGR